MSLSPYELLRPADLPVPQLTPFTTAQAVGLGVSPRTLGAWRQHGLIRTPLRGVHHVVSLPDSLELRLACLELVMPRDAVVCDRTAGWLHGAPMILAPGDHLQVPRAALYSRPGNRLRNGVAVGGERTFQPGDVVEVGGLLVTSPLRTACDLGRLLHRDQAFAALCMMTRLGELSVDELVASVEEYAGYRGVRQLRELAPRTEPRVQSPGEAILLLRWTDCGDLPRPEPQVPVEGPEGTCYLDLGVPDLQYSAEYDGAEWHDEDQLEADARRRRFLTQHGGWIIDPLRGHNIHGRAQDSELILRAGVRRALERRTRTSA